MQFGPTFAASGAGAPAHAETHSAVLFFVGDRAYKVKKPVDLGFLDFSTADARRRACHRELELNRRLAPDVYLGVVDVVDTEGAPCEHLLVMRRMPPQRRLTRLLAERRDVAEVVRAIAQQVARFHEGAAAVEAPSDYADSEAVRSNWEDNLATLRRFPEMIDPDAREYVGRLAGRYLSGRTPLLRERIEAGRVRDGHGDLLTDDIFCLDDGPRILDCLDFSVRYRYGDVLLDAAFLAMDLERQGHADLARSFLQWWCEAAGDRYPDSLAHHYLAYRAHVRAKVACLRAEQGLSGAVDTARGLHALAEHHLEAGRIRMVLVGGAPGTGKSTLARGLAETTGFALLRSDEVRKELAGLNALDDATAAPNQGLYSKESTAATYAELVDRAAVLTARGESVILDATWSAAGHREAAARAADETRTDLVALRCTAPEEVAERRLRRRGPDASDATLETARRLASTADEWPAAARVDTAPDPEQVVDAALAHVGGTASLQA